MPNVVFSLPQRIALLASAMAVSLLSSVAYVGLAGGPKIVDVRISYPEPTRNMSFGGALETITNTSRTLKNMVVNGSAELGMRLGEAVSLIEEAQTETDQMWHALEQEIVSHYVNIRNMIYRLDAACVDPSKFRDWWFENPSDSTVYAELAKQANISSVEILDDGGVDIQLSANRSLASVTYRTRWTGSSGEIVSTRTHVLVREDSSWKFRRLDLRLGAQEG